MKSMKKLVLAGLVLLASVMVLVGCKNDSVPEVPKYTVQFNKNAEDVTGTMENQIFTQDVKQALKKNVFTRNGYAFTGWKVKDSETSYKDEEEISLTSDVELLAQWQKNHEHSFAEQWTHDGTHHWKAATCGDTNEVSGYAEHTFVNEVCSICNYSRIPKGFVWVPGGTIEGAAYTDNYGGVFIEDRTVTLSDFYMGKYEVTQEEYASVMAGQKVTVDGQEYHLESNPSYCTEGSTKYTLFDRDDPVKRPVEGVTWYDAVWYCNALSEKVGLEKAYDIEVTEVKQASGKTGYYIYGATVTLNKDANGYRLPTEAEWEYAARGGNPDADEWDFTFSGADTADGKSYTESKNAGLDAVGWYWYNTETGTTGETGPTSGGQGYGTHQVGKKEANILGIYDMSGNVWEWCYDWYDTITTETAPQGASSGSYRVLRGGSWFSGADYASVSYRYDYYPNYRYSSLGFRVVRASSK